MNSRGDQRRKERIDLRMSTGIERVGVAVGGLLGGGYGTASSLFLD